MCVSVCVTPTTAGNLKLIQFGMAGGEDVAGINSGASVAATVAPLEQPNAVGEQAVRPQQTSRLCLFSLERVPRNLFTALVNFLGHGVLCALILVSSAHLLVGVSIDRATKTFRFVGVKADVPSPAPFFVDIQCCRCCAGCLQDNLLLL